MNPLILKSLNPITLQSNPSNGMKQFADKWLTAGLIPHLRAELSKVFPFNPNGYDLTPYLGKDVEDIEVFNQKHFQLVSFGLPKTLLNQYNLGESWLWFLMFSLYFNAVLDLEVNQGFLDQDPILFLTGKKSIAQKLFDFGDKEVMALLLPFHTSRQQIHDWIDDHAQEIEQAMDQHLVKAVPLLEYMQNWSIGQEIEKLKESGLSFTNISKQLTDKYPFDQRMCDLDQIKKLLKRYQESKTKFSEHIKAVMAISGDK